PAELKAAIVRLGGDPDGQAEPRSLPRGAGARIEKLEAELGRGLAAEDPRPRLRHRVVVRGGKRRVLVSFLDVEIDELDRFARSVQRGAKG
ncbi:MAG: hypothetical protein HUU15_02095, partial [Candidatus Brocadiae bacterium]|nr:hypothetical protein [Candidatus Brocadiia bacterium]